MKIVQMYGKYKENIQTRRKIGSILTELTVNIIYTIRFFITIKKIFIV